LTVCEQAKSSSFASSKVEKLSRPSPFLDFALSPLRSKRTVRLGWSRYTLTAACLPDEHEHEPVLIRAAARRSGGGQRAVIVAVIAVRAVQAAIHEIIRMLAVRHRFVPAIRAVDMAVGMLRAFLAAVRMLGIDGDHMLVDMVAVRVMKMAVVQIVDVPVMPDRLVAATRPVLMRMIPMRVMFAHIPPPRFRPVVAQAAG
jgi:hypothetical protein